MGHLVAIRAAHDGYERREPSTLLATSLLYARMAAAAASVLRTPGRALHDRAAGTRVTRTA